MFLVIDCNGLNRDDGLDLSQLMTKLITCPCDEVVFSKEAFTNLGPAMQGTQMVRWVTSTFV